MSRSAATRTHPSQWAAMPTDYAPFAHLTTPNSDLYRAVMRTFLAAKERFAVHLRPEDVHASMAADNRPAELEPVVKALDALVGWGNLRADPDTARVTAVEDFYRKRFIYQLTRAGEATEAALGTYDEVLGRRGELQAVALHDIVTQLRALLVIAAEKEPDPAKAYVALSVLTSRFADLADNARAFMGSLQRTIDLHDVEIETFLAYKDRLIQYLERFIQDLITLGGRIAALIGELGSQGRVGPLLDLAALRDAADAAPEEAAQAEKAAQARWAARWSGLAEWFVSGEERESQARLLRGRALNAIPQLLAVVRQLNERRAGRSDRSADFRELARWFAHAPDDETRHRLWRVAFGLYSSRHLTVDADTLAERLSRPEPASTPWADARPLRISPQLRRTGSYERRGRPRRVTNRSEAKRELAELAARQTEQVREARALLVTDGPVRLSDLGELDPRAFDLFLRLLGDALATWRPETTSTTATSGDGSMEIRLTALDDGTTAEVYTPHGVFSGPDHLVEIVAIGSEGDASTTGLGTRLPMRAVPNQGGPPSRSAVPSGGRDAPATRNTEGLR